MGFVQKIKNFIFSRRFIVNILLIIVFWVLVIVCTLYYFKSYSKHGEAIDVPTFVDENIHDIPALMGDRDLRYEIIDSIYNPDLKEGTIVFQNPLPTDTSGVKVKSGRVIHLRVTKQSRLVEIPSVVSRSERFAEAVLKSKGMRTRIKYVNSNEDIGVVMEQEVAGKSIQGGEKVPINSLVLLTVGKQSRDGEVIKVPDLTGLTINEAKERFEEETELRLSIICTHCETKSDSLQARVIRQTPVATDSSAVPAGTTITIFSSPNGEDAE